MGSEGWTIDNKNLTNYAGMNTPPPSNTQPSTGDTPPSRGNMWRNWVVGWIVVASFVVVIAVALLPMMISCPKSPRTEAVANSKSIGLALFNFDQDYGKFPDASTIEAVRKKETSHLPLGTRSSNDFFRQLIAGGYADSEKVFYANIKGSRKSDGDMSPAHALEKGECGFSYILGADLGADEPCNPLRPILVTPLIPGTTRFDPKPFKGTAVIYRADNSAKCEKINDQGDVIDSSGKALFDPANPVWDDKPPVIAWPE